MENTSVGPGGGASICLSFCLFGDPPRPVAAVWLHGAPSPAPARAASPARGSALAAALASLFLRAFGSPGSVSALSFCCAFIVASKTGRSSCTTPVCLRSRFFDAFAGPRRSPKIFSSSALSAAFCGAFAHMHDGAELPAATHHAAAGGAAWLGTTEVRLWETALGNARPSPARPG